MYSFITHINGKRSGDESYTHERTRRGVFVPSPTLSPTDPVPRGLLTLCPAAY